MSELSDWMGYTQLKKALRSGQIEEAKLLIESGAKVDADRYPQLKTPIWDPNIECSITPLHLAVEAGSLDIVKLLVSRGASIIAKNDISEIPLFLAVRTKKYDIASYLLSLIEKYNSQYYQWDNNLTLLHIACLTDNLDSVKKLIEHGEDLNTRIKNYPQRWLGFTPLHFAVEYASNDVVEYLLDCGAEVNVKNNDGLTALHLAYELKNLRAVDSILAVHNYEFSNPTNKKGLSHFHIACTRNNASIVEGFINRGVDIKRLELSGIHTPLYLAVHHECTEVLRLLLGYNPPLKSAFVNIIKEAYWTRNQEIVNLIEAKDQFESKKLKFYWARDTGFTSFHVDVKLMRVKKIFPSDKKLMVKQDLKGRTPLHLAFEMKQMEIVDLILQSLEDITENPIDNEGLSHFHISCTCANLKVVEFLIENGVDINKPVPMTSKFWPGYTPMHLAVEFGQDQVFKLLLDRNADLFIRNKDELTSYELAIFTFDRERNTIDKKLAQIIKAVLTRVAEKNIDSFEDHGFSLLFMHTMYNLRGLTEGHLELLELQPEKINQRITYAKSKYHHYTPMDFLDNRMLHDVIDKFIEQGADLLMPDAGGTTRFQYFLPFHPNTVEKCQLDLVNLSDTNLNGWTYLHTLCRSFNPKLAERFLEMGADVNEPMKFKHGKSKFKAPLHIAMKYWQYGSVEFLLEHGADPNVYDREWYTPLHCGAKTLVNINFKLLLHYGANVNARSLYNETPLHMLSNVWNEGHFTIVDMLLEYGADVNIEDDWGKTAVTKIKFWDADDNTLIYYTVIMKHVKKLSVLGYYVRDKNLEHYRRFVDLCKERGVNFDEESFINACLAELEQLGNTYVDRYTSLRSLLYKSVHQMTFHCQNDTLKEMIEQTNFTVDFSNYGYLIRLKFDDGTTRKPLLDTCRKMFKALSVVSLPDSCVYHVLEYLSFDDLENLSLCDDGSS